MELIELMKIASKAYSTDETMAEYFDPETGLPRKNPNGGDLFAEGAVHEIFETYDEKASDNTQLIQASRVLESAADQLNTTSLSFWEHIK